MSTVIFIETSSYVETTEETSQGNSTVTSWEVERVHRHKSISVGRHHDVHHLDIGWDLPEGPVTGYLIYAIYSTGDSFNHEECGRIEMFDFYRTHEEAAKAVDVLTHAGQKLVKGKAGRPFTWEPETDYTKLKTTVTLSSGRTLEYHAPWLGHFETLSSIVAVPFTL